jgi:hypothetical protein
MQPLDDLTEQASAHYIHSTLRERIVEHVFVGEALRRLWQRGVTGVEVLRSEFDAGGYDLVMSYKAITRHIQFKTVTLGGRAPRVTASLKLMEKPSGCIIWIVVSPDLDLVSYLWFGNAPDVPLPDISGFPVACHAKGTSTGKKNERPMHRVIAKGKFEKIASLDLILGKLFGPLP